MFLPRTTLTFRILHDLCSTYREFRKREFIIHLFVWYWLCHTERWNYCTCTDKTKESLTFYRFIDRIPAPPQPLPPKIVVRASDSALYTVVCLNMSKYVLSYDSIWSYAGDLFLSLRVLKRNQCLKTGYFMK